MIIVGAFEAKTHLSRLLEKVAAGEVVVITKRGKPLARLTRADEGSGHGDLDKIIAQLKALRVGFTLGEPWRDLRDEDRK